MTGGIDNGSALNCCPMKTDNCLGLGPTDFTPSSQTIRVYDSSRSEVKGTATLPIVVGPLQHSNEKS